jgi:hypothetical protein
MLFCIGAYSCLLFRMCCAYADLGTFVFIYLQCSMKRVFRLRPVCPMYRLLQVLHSILYIPLFVYLSLFLMWVFRRFCVVLLTRYVMFSFVFLKMLVTFLIMGLWYSNITHFLVVVLCLCIRCFVVILVYNLFI